MTKLSLREIEIPPPGLEMASVQGGWSDVLVKFEDQDLFVYPAVKISVHVPYTQDETIQGTRETALENAKEILRAALQALEATTIDELNQKAAARRAKAEPFRVSSL